LRCDLGNLGGNAIRETAHTAAGGGAVSRPHDMPSADLATAGTAAHHGLTLLHDEKPIARHG